MSWEKPRCALGKCLPERRMGVACALVREEGTRRQKKWSPVILNGAAPLVILNEDAGGVKDLFEDTEISNKRE